jgi:hypothetical protein
MNLTMDIKTLITVGGIVALLGGFYYSTQHRLDTLESQIGEVSQKLDTQRGEIRQLRKQIRNKDNK